MWRAPDVLDMIYFDRYTKGEAWRYLQSDIMRLEILLRHGGVYVDADTICLKPLDPLFRGQTISSFGPSAATALSGPSVNTNRGFIAWESEKHRPGLLANGVMALPPYSTAAILLVHQLDYTDWNAPAWISTGPKFVTDVLDKFNLTLARVPSQLFYPYHLGDALPKDKDALQQLLQEKDPYMHQLWSSSFENFNMTHAASVLELHAP